jgi:hypothetical protein
MLDLRFIVVLICLSLAISSRAESEQLPNAPQPSTSLLAANAPDSGEYSSSANRTAASDLAYSLEPGQTSQSAHDTNHDDPRSERSSNAPLDANGNCRAALKSRISRLYFSTIFHHLTAVLQHINRGLEYVNRGQNYA